MNEREVHLKLSDVKIDNDNLDYIKMTGEICGRLRDDLVKLFAISDVRSSNYSMVTKEGLYKIMHEHYTTDRYQYGSTIVSASSKEEAMKKLNEYLETKPDGVYTALPCEDIKYVWELKVLE